MMRRFFSVKSADQAIAIVEKQIPASDQKRGHITTAILLDDPHNDVSDVLAACGRLLDRRLLCLSFRRGDKVVRTGIVSVRLRISSNISV